MADAILDAMASQLRGVLIDRGLDPAVIPQRSVPPADLAYHEYQARGGEGYDDADEFVKALVYRVGHPYETAEWVTMPVELNHLEAMGICMSLMAEQERDGLSEPQADALIKVHEVLSKLLGDLGRPS